MNPGTGAFPPHLSPLPHAPEAFLGQLRMAVTRRGSLLPSAISSYSKASSWLVFKGCICSLSDIRETQLSKLSKPSVSPRLPHVASVFAVPLMLLV